MKFRKVLHILLLNVSVLYVVSFAAGALLSLIRERSLFIGKPKSFSRVCINDTAIINPVFGYLINNCDPANSLPSRIGFTKEFSLDSFPNADNSIYSDVLVLGGSVASHLSRDSILEKELQSALNMRSDQKKIKPKRVRVFNAAVEGFKQPQGVHSFLALRSLGYKFDAVIELSGFNEVVLPLADNYPIRLPLYYPRHASSYLKYSSSALEKSYLSAILAAPVTYHPLIVFYNSIWVSTLMTKIAYPDKSWVALNRAVGYSHGPKITDEEDAFKIARNIYLTSTEAVQQLAELDKAKYFLFLQPNQHIVNTKKFTDEENENIFPRSLKLFELTNTSQQDLEYARISKNYYSRLKKSEFISINHFYDLRDIFKAQSPQTLYVDNCCHLNDLGMKLLAERISSVVYPSLPNSALHVH